MLRRIRRRIPSSDLCTLIFPVLRSRLQTLFKSRVQSHPVDQICVQSAISARQDVESGYQQGTHERQVQVVNEGDKGDEQLPPLGTFQLNENILNRQPLQSRLNLVLQPPPVVQCSPSNETIELENLEVKNAGPGFKPQNAKQVEIPEGHPEVSEDLNRIVDLEQSEDNDPGNDQTEDDSGLPEYPTYMHTHFQILYYLGLSPTRGDGTSGSKRQFEIFVIITIIGLCFFFLQCKQYIVDDAKVGDLTHYITVCYFTCCLFVQLYITKLFAFDGKFISGILRTHDQERDKELYRQPTRKFALEPIIFASIILILSCAVVIRPDWMFDGDTFTSVFLSRSWSTACYIFVWKNDTNLTALLTDQYGSELDTPSVLLGTAGVIMRFIGYLKENLIRDILLMSALHTYRLSTIFENAMAKQLIREGATDRNLDNLKEIHEAVLNMTNIINPGLKNFFKVIHMESWMVCQYLLIDILRGDVWNVYSLTSFVLVPKIIAAYYFCAEATIKSNATRSMIQSEYNRKKSHEVDKAAVCIFIKELDDHPIGIGRGQFQLDEAFFTKFIGIVISCFLLYADSDKEKSTNCVIE